jgi:hypothetical protein
VLAKQTVIDASTMQAPLKCVTMMDGTVHLFKKQRLRLNPTLSTQQQYTHHTLTHDGGIEDESMDDNDNVSLADDNASPVLMNLLVMKILSRTMILLTLLKSLLRVITHALLLASNASHLLSICLTPWNVLIMHFKKLWNGHINVMKQVLILIQNAKHAWVI